MKCVKKLVAVLLTAVMALTLLTACGGGGGSTSGGDSMETVFNFTGEELTQLLNESLESDMVYHLCWWQTWDMRRLKRVSI